MTREEAIETIMSATVWDDDEREALGILIPELKENEDEKNANALIRLLNNEKVSSLITFEAKQQWLDWLERQKELPFVKDVMLGYPGLYFYDGERMHFQGNPAMEEKQKEQKPVERSLEDDHIIGFVYDLLNEIEWKDKWAMSKEECLRRLNNYRPQKPAEWDDYTKTNLDRAIRIIKDVRGNLYGYQSDDGIYECDKAIEALEHFLYRGLEIENLVEWSKEDNDIIEGMIIDYEGEIEHLSDSIIDEQAKPIYQGRIDFLKRLKTYCPQTHNKDVQKIINDSIFLIEHYASHGHNKKLRENAINGLKSLRPSWKLSEQEKGALRTAIHVLTEERNFPKTAGHLQAILDAFDGKEARKDWKPSEEQMDALSEVLLYDDGATCWNKVQTLYEQLKKLM